MGTTGLFNGLSLGDNLMQRMIREKQILFHGRSLGKSHTLGTPYTPTLGPSFGSVLTITYVIEPRKVRGCTTLNYLQAAYRRRNKEPRGKAWQQIKLQEMKHDTHSLDGVIMWVDGAAFIPLAAKYNKR